MSYNQEVFPYLYSNPSGSQTDSPITFPLSEVFAEFPGRTVQTNQANNAVGLFSNDRPYSLPIWSTPATGQWEPTPYLIIYQRVVPEPPHHAITPEPRGAVLLLMAFFLVMLWRVVLRAR